MVEQNFAEEYLLSTDSDRRAKLDGPGEGLTSSDAEGNVQEVQALVTTCRERSAILHQGNSRP